MTYKNAVSWFEIPATDLDRAQKFYETILDISMNKLDLANLKMRLFPLGDPMGIGGALCLSPGFYNPSASYGPLIYLNGNPDVQLILDKVEQAGGKILVPKTLIAEEFGHMAMIIDTEGNRVAFHSLPQR